MLDAECAGLSGEPHKQVKYNTTMLIKLKEAQSELNRPGDHFTTQRNKMLKHFHCWESNESDPR